MRLYKSRVRVFWWGELITRGSDRAKRKREEEPMPRRKDLKRHRIRWLILQTYIAFRFILCLCSVYFPNKCFFRSDAYWLDLKGYKSTNLTWSMELKLLLLLFDCYKLDVCQHKYSSRNNLCAKGKSYIWIFQNCGIWFPYLYHSFFSRIFFQCVPLECVPL